VAAADTIDAYGQLWSVDRASDWSVEDGVVRLLVPGWLPPRVAEPFALQLRPCLAGPGSRSELAPSPRGARLDSWDGRLPRDSDHRRATEI